MKRNVSLYLLHGLMNVPVENGHGAKLLQVRESLRTVLSAPSPFRIYGPERNMREDDNRRAGLQMLYIFFQPLELLLPQRAQAAGFQVHHVDQPHEVHAFLLEAVPASWLSAFAEALVVLLAVVVQHIVLARDIKNILGRSALQNLLDAVEFFRLREVADISCVQQKFRRRR